MADSDKKQSNEDCRLLSGQKFYFFIGIIINALLIFSLRSISAPPAIRPPSVQIRQKNYTVRTFPLPYTVRTFPLPNQDNSEDWITIIVVCGNGETDIVREMQPLLTSAILLSSAPLHFVFVTDNGSANRIQRMFEDDLKYSKKPIKVDTWVLSEGSVNAFSSMLDYNPTFHHSGIWGTSKLMLPWIVKDVEKAVQVDSDMIFLDDPARIWNEFFDIDDEETNGEWLYKMPLHDPSGAHSICSCIVLLKLDEIRHSNTFPTLMEDALATQPDWKKENNMYDTPNGDQGLYWTMLNKYGSQVIRPLPEQWNAERCHDYFDVLRTTSQKAVSVLHNNCDYHNDYGAAKEYFAFYEKYRWHWLKGSGAIKYAVNVTLHPEETERLQDIFECLKEKGNYSICTNKAGTL